MPGDCDLISFDTGCRANQADVSQVASFSLFVVSFFWRGEAVGAGVLVGVSLDERLLDVLHPALAVVLASNQPHAK